MHRLDDPSYVEREYASLDPLRMRRLDKEQTLLSAIAETGPGRVLDVGCVGRSEAA